LIDAEVIANEGLIEYLRAPKLVESQIAIEDIVSYGKSIGKTTIETAVFIGRVIEAAQIHKISVFRYSRRDYGFWITGGAPISDASIRAGLESHYGGYGKGLLDVFGIIRLFMQDEVFQGNGESATETAEWYKTKSYNFLATAVQNVSLNYATQHRLVSYIQSIYATDSSTQTSGADTYV
jgi:hypothetical protein